MGTRHTPQEEEAFFYPAYGQTRPDPVAQAYYRYERIIQDISEFCEQIISTTDSDKTREQSFQYLASIFRPRRILEISYGSDNDLGQDQLN